MIAWRSDRWKLLGIAGGFAALATIMWSTMVVLDSGFDSPATDRVAEVLAYTNLILNMGGAFVTLLLQLSIAGPLAMIFGTGPVVSHPVLDALSWAGTLATVFVGAFAQGFVYGVWGLVGFRWCRGRRTRRSLQLR